MAEKKKNTSAKTGTKTRKTTEQKEREAQISLEKEKLLKKNQLLHDEITAIILIAVGLFLFLSLQTESAGTIGAFISDCCFGLFGKAAYILPYFVILLGVLIFARLVAFLSARTWISIAMLFIFISALFAKDNALALESISLEIIPSVFKQGISGGGVIGTCTAYLLIKLVGVIGLYIISAMVCFIAVLFIVNTPVSVYLDNLKFKIRAKKAAREEMEAIMLAEKNKYKPNADGKEKSGSAFADTPKFELPKLKNAFDEEEPEEPVLTKDEKARKEMDEAEQALTESFESEIAKFENADDYSQYGAETEVARDTIGLVGSESYEAVFKDDKYKQNIVNNEDMTESQQNIVNLVTDSNLFADNNRSQSSAERANTSSEIHSENFSSGSRKRKSSVKNDEEDINIPQPVINHTGEYKFPPLSLLSAPQKSRPGANGGNLQEQANLLEDALASFGVNASVVNVTKGPAVTRFEVQPAAGVKVASIVRLQDDIALHLKAKSIRIEAPIPGKAAIGIEIANSSSSTITLREVLESKSFKDAKSKISVGLGKDISGESIIANLKDMPHLLIAGATGSGKSVCINSIIISLLYKADPNEVKLILVDPKVVELSNYNGIPHLMIPVVTDPAKAAGALNWGVAEMNERYNLFAQEGVRDLQSYNDLMRANGETEKLLPQVVIIIDELADLIMAAQNSVEDAISRLAAKARAAGMHLILATQRPSVDVITGVIKANIPSRIAFAVASGIDSRTILDETGAEKLLGRGDMLYFPQGISKPVRVQGCFISDKEVNAVIDYVKAHSNEAEYSEKVITALEKVGSGPQNGGSDDSDDELLKDAIECVVRAEQCSVSMLQRRFRIGYNRSARLVDMMEERGIVGPADGSRPRKVNMTLAEFEQLYEQFDDGEDSL